MFYRLVRYGAILAIVLEVGLGATRSETAAQDVAGLALEAPTEAVLGMPVYPAAEFLTSYDAGRGQRYYLFGTQSSFSEIVRYYSVVLDTRGDRVFNAPPVHTFPIGRFRENRMGFQPGVTVKDYTWNESEGFLNPTPGAGDQRFATVIQIVPAPVESEARR